jgi:hypothetical protein
MFGNEAKRQAGNAAMRGESERLSALSLADLAAEVMARVFGPGGTGADGSAIAVGTAANAFISEEASWCNEDAPRALVVRVVGEGLQMLEHACLISTQLMLIGNEHWAIGWSATRAGESALADSAVAEALAAVTSEQPRAK